MELRKKIIAAILAAASCITVSSCNHYSEEEIRAAYCVNLPDLPDYSSYITINKYTGLDISIDDSKYAVTDADVEQRLFDTFYLLADQTEITDRAAASGDIVHISYVGTIDGEEFAGGTTNEDGDVILIGRGKYPEKFENDLIGMKKDEEKDIEITFADDYMVESLRGKTAIFKTKVLDIVELTMPEMNDELAQTYSTYSTMDELRQGIRDELEESANAEKDDELYSMIMDSILSNATFNEYPPQLMNDLIDTAINAVEVTAHQYGTDTDTFVKDAYGFDTLDAYRDSVREQAGSYLKIRMALVEIAKKENINVSPQEFTEYKINFADTNGFSDMKCVNIYYKDEDLLVDQLTPKIREFLLKNAIKMT